MGCFVREKDVLQGMITGFAMDCQVAGDVTVGLWFGDHKRQWDPPAIAYAFNANFVQAGVVRLNAGDVDFPGLHPKFKSCSCSRRLPECNHRRAHRRGCHGGWLENGILVAGGVVNSFAADASGFFMDLVFEEISGSPLPRSRQPVMLRTLLHVSVAFGRD